MIKKIEKEIRRLELYSLKNQYEKLQNNTANFFEKNENTPKSF
ncbi:hypothetical protein [Holdemanella porci]